MVVTCEIEFDQNPYATYFAGQQVNGTVVLKSSKPKDVKGVLLKIVGRASTNWRERRFNRRQTFFGREDYLASLTYLMGSEESEKCTIETGLHSYNFACQLPIICPSSYEGNFGSIRYVVKVLLVRPWKFDQTYTRAFTVLNVMDLNYDTPQLRIPANSEAYKIFCCGPCKTDPLSVKLNIPQSGYVPGQSIPVNAVIVNNTSLPVKEVQFSLIMLVRYYSTYPQQHSRIERITVTKVQGESVLRNSTRSLTAELQVPATPPTCLSQCTILQIAYQVEVEACMQAFYANQVIALPITIGNVPLWDRSAMVLQQQPTSSNNRALPDLAASASDALGGCLELTDNSADTKMTVAATESSARVSMPNDIYSNMPPPSYEESMHTVRCDINEGELHAFGPSEFAPLYPVYNISSPSVVAANGDQNGGHTNPNFES